MGAIAEGKWKEVAGDATERLAGTGWQKAFEVFLKEGGLDVSMIGTGKLRGTGGDLNS